MNKLNKIISQVVSQLSSVPTAVLNRLKCFYKINILKDEFAIAVNKWFSDNDDELLRFDYPLTKDSIVFDLGGYKGDFSYEINIRYGCSVYL